MKNFYVTFGQKYAHEQHPKFIGAHPDGWVRIMAEDYESARECAFEEFSSAWAFIYDEESFDHTYFPMGELTVIFHNPSVYIDT